MRKFILRSILFCSPFFLLHLINLMYYPLNKGDLLRVGFLYDISNYREEISHSFDHIPSKYTLISELDFSQKDSFTVMTIGDSFSEQDSLGYNNYLANLPNISVLHLDRHLHDNPLQTTQSLANGDFFDQTDVQYVVLQSVERHIINRTKNLNREKILTIDSLKKRIEPSASTQAPKKIRFFSGTTLKAPLANLLYQFQARPNFSMTYKVKTNEPFFSGKANNLLFFQDDLWALKMNHDKAAISLLNEELNYLNQILSQKNIKLIVLISPDKYGVYYDHISDTSPFPTPIFFDEFNNLQKEYKYVNSKQTAERLLEEKKDIYYYDDTHWSPITAKEMAMEIGEIILRDKMN